jgi:hypothetical protein
MRLGDENVTDIFLRTLRVLFACLLLGCVFIGLWRLFAVWMTPSPPFKTWADVGDAAKAIALVAAAFYFLWKTVSGYEITNLTLDVSATRRASSSPGTDWINVHVRVKKGARGTVQLHDAVVRLTPGKGGPLLGFQRLAISDATHRKVLWGDSSGEYLNIAADEETSFSYCGEVSRAVPCSVEVALIGFRRFWPFHPSQWRASIISLPE